MKEEKRGHLAQQLVQLRRHLVHVARVAEQRRCLLLCLSSAMHGYAQVLQQRLHVRGRRPVGQLLLLLVRQRHLLALAYRSR